MGIPFFCDIKTTVKLPLIIIISVLLALLLVMFIVAAVIRETGAIGGCKKISYGPGQEGKCGNGYFVVSILDNDGILRNPEAAPTAGYMICCRAEI